MRNKRLVKALLAPAIVGCAMFGVNVVGAAPAAAADRCDPWTSAPWCTAGPYNSHRDCDLAGLFYVHYGVAFRYYCQAGGYNGSTWWLHYQKSHPARAV